MRKLFIILCVFTAFNVSPVVAKTDTEQLAGEWHGEIVSKQGNTTFIFRFEANGSKLTGQVKIAGSNGNGLSIEHFELINDNIKFTFNKGMAEYQGKYRGDQITGELKTRGVAVVLNMEKGKYQNPYALAISRDAMEKINGEWHGELKGPDGTVLYIFRFGQNGAGEYVGFADNPYYSDFNAPITEAVLDGDKLEFKVPNLLMTVSGSLTGNHIKASLKIKHPYTGTFPISLDKGHYEIPDLSCNLPKEAVEKLMGTWNGHLNPPGMTMENIFHVATRADGKVYCYYDNPTLGFYGSIMVNKLWDDGRMAFETVFPNDAEFKANLSGNRISGAWHKAGATIPARYDKTE